jgi:hypothetical protein
LALTPEIHLDIFHNPRSEYVKPRNCAFTPGWVRNSTTRCRYTIPSISSNSSRPGCGRDSMIR